MKIDFEDGAVETDTLSDKEAVISEALNNLHKVCQQYNVTSFSRIILNDKKYLGQNTVVKNDPQLQKDFEFLMKTINDFVDKVTMGQVILMRVKPEETAAE